MLRYVIIFFIGFFYSSGCSPLPCKPPSYYAPDPDAPCTVQEVRVPTLKGYSLAGTLTLPSDFPSPYPAVVLITGSHPQDRDMLGSHKEPINKYRPFRQLADALSRKGIAVLRMDDRGYGCSEGNDINDATIPERAEDIEAGLDYLRGRNKIDNHRLGLLGISEGANIGLMIASADPTIQALIVMAGSASSGREILKWQVLNDTAQIEGITDEERDRILEQRLKDVEKWIAGGQTKPWRKSFVEYNPLSSARNVLCPVLIIHGDRDSHVPVEHARLLAETMMASGNTDVTVRILHNHNHLFLKDADGRFTNKRYLKLLNHTNELSENLLKLVSDWFSSRLNTK